MLSFEAYFYTLVFLQARQCEILTLKQQNWHNEKYKRVHASGFDGNIMTSSSNISLVPCLE